MTAVRRAEATWEGDLLSGKGTVSAVSSGVFHDLQVSWGARTESPEGKTSPEELMAAAHASCFEMALSGALARGGTPPEHLAVTHELTFIDAHRVRPEVCSRGIAVGAADPEKPAFGIGGLLRLVFPVRAPSTPPRGYP